VWSCWVSFGYEQLENNLNKIDSNIYVYEQRIKKIENSLYQDIDIDKFKKFEMFYTELELNLLNCEKK